MHVLSFLHRIKERHKQRNLRNNSRSNGFIEAAEDIENGGSLNEAFNLIFFALIT